MGYPLTGKAITNESDYPNIVEIAVAAGGLDVEVGRQMMDFHRSRKIQARHGRRIFKEDQVHFRWCFSDVATARAFSNSLAESFERGGDARRIAANVGKLEPCGRSFVATMAGQYEPPKG